MVSPQATSSAADDEIPPVKVVSEIVLLPEVAPALVAVFPPTYWRDIASPYYRAKMPDAFQVTVMLPPLGVTGNPVTPVSIYATKRDVPAVPVSI